MWSKNQLSHKIVKCFFFPAWTQTVTSFHLVCRRRCECLYDFPIILLVCSLLSCQERSAKINILHELCQKCLEFLCFKLLSLVSLSAAVRLLPCDVEVTCSNRGNSLSTYGSKAVYIYLSLDPTWWEFCALAVLLNSSACLTLSKFFMEENMERIFYFPYQRNEIRNL